jgi:class 3 adenylate cyclase
MELGQENAVLFAELIGAPELYARAGDAAAHRAIIDCTGRLSQAAAACDSRVIKTIGSRLMVLAPSGDAAARAAVAMQVAAGEFPVTAASRLELGVGFHYGPVIQEQHDIFGDTVNLAARLVEQAAKGQVLFAAETAEALSAPYRRLMRRLYSIPMKGRSEEVALCELVWRTDAAATFLPPDGATKPPPARLTLRYRGTNLVLHNGFEALTIGREQGCGLVIADAQASRHHCSIQRRNDHFVLADRSTNGTYVLVEGEDETRLDHDELTLRRRGWISCGGPRGEAEAFEFVCD